MAEKEVVSTELPESVRSNIRNKTLSQTSNSSILPDNSAKSSLLDGLAGDSIQQLPVVDSLAGHRIHGLPNITQPRFEYFFTESIHKFHLFQRGHPT